MAKILIIDDDLQLCGALALVIQRLGHRTDTAFTLKDGKAKVEAGEYDVVILDIRLPDGNGLEALPTIRDSKSAPEVIILSGSGDPDGAELAIRSGAWSYITKPPTMNKIQLPVERAVEYRSNKRTAAAPMALKRERIIGTSRAVLDCLDVVAQAAGTEANVLISGETGTGKELFARAIHDNSPRAGKPFVVVDCAALPEKLVESMLFGHAKGAFTGADRKATGLIKQADGGTLFLDEVGELPMSLQKSFLRVLQDRRFRPVGAAGEENSDFRLVAATNRELEYMVEKWAFRQDLLFRLRTIGITLPPLRERTGDVPLLANHFIARWCSKIGFPSKSASPEFYQELEEYSWPGNVRELGNAMESAVMASAGETILYPRHLPIEIRARLTRESLEKKKGRNTRHLSPESGTGLGPGSASEPDPSDFPKLKEFRADALAELEKQYLADLMSVSKGDIKTACSVSGLSRARLYALMKEHGVTRPK